MRFQASRLGQAAGVVLLAVTGIANPAGAQDSLPHYLSIAPLGEYLMPARELEIALARSAAPESVSARTGCEYGGLTVPRESLLVLLTPG